MRKQRKLCTINPININPITLFTIHVNPMFGFMKQANSVNVDVQNVMRTLAVWCGFISWVYKRNFYEIIYCYTSITAFTI